MIEPNHLYVLRKICQRLRSCQSPWAITGSAGMALQGMDMEVHDIDLQTDERGAYEIEGLLSEYVVTAVRYLSSERIRSHLGVLEMEGVKVEVMGDIQKLVEGQMWEKPVNVTQYRHWIDFEGMHIPVLSLEYEHQAYLKMGRVEKAEKIRQWLDDHNKGAVIQSS